MELRIYDPELNLLGITENQTSVTWTRKYYEPGTFRIYLPITQDNLNLYQLGNIVSFRGANDGGVIEDILLQSTDIDRIMRVDGRFLASYMDRRLIRPTVHFSGYTEVAMRQMLTGAVAIPQVELGELQGFTETVEFQATYKDLLDYETKLAKSASMGYRFRPDFTEKIIYFEVYKGVDRSRAQTDRAFVEFSDKFDNLNKVTRRQNDQLLKNVAYVGGQGQDEERVFVTVGDDSLVGLARREYYVDARDLSPYEITEAQYKANLRERGIQKLKERVYSDSFECVATPTGNYEYKKDYDLGDIVTVRKSDWNVFTEMRITEVSEVYEYGTANIIPTFGTPLPESIDWED